ncbi:major capsid protein [Tortoise microvirus 107]|nr:major capsid protein [Tortoise microvirus 107]
MSQTQLSQKLGTNNSIFDVKEEAKVRRSAFDYSRKHNTTIDIGGIYPVDWFRYYPGDNIQVSIRYLLDTLPLAVPPATSYKVRTHWYAVGMSSLYAGWNTFITGGRSGIQLSLPVISASEEYGGVWDMDGSHDSLYRAYFPVSSYSDYYSPSTPMSLATYLGVPASAVVRDSTIPQYLPFLPLNTASGGGVFTQLNSNPSDIGVLALPFMAYQKIYRHAYLPGNLLQDNKVWFPDNLDTHWRIEYDKSNLRPDGFFVPSGSFPVLPGGVVCNYVPSVADNCVNLWQLRYAPFEMDYFTSAKPWLVRGGQETSLSSDIDISNLDIIADQPALGIVPLTSESVTMSAGTVYNQYDGVNTSTMGISGTGMNPETLTASRVFYKFGVSPDVLVNRLGVSGSATTQLSLTANTLRNLIAVSVWQERNALTSGNYNAMVRAHWGVKPRQPDYEPVYLGGTSDVVQFSKVLQTSASEGTQVLGQEASIGRVSGGASVFNYRATDYGIIMGVMVISPEVTYSQGIGHEFTDITQDDWFTPEFAQLGYEPVLNREIMVTNSESDSDLFGYTTRFSYLKQRRNFVSGLMAVRPEDDAYFSAFSQSRYFKTLPALSLQFAVMSPQNIRRDFLAFPNYPAFRLQFASDVRLVRALPYQSEPNTFGF